MPLDIAEYIGKVLALSCFLKSRRSAQIPRRPTTCVDLAPGRGGSPDRFLALVPALDQIVRQEKGLVMGIRNFPGVRALSAGTGQIHLTA